MHAPVWDAVQVQTPLVSLPAKLLLQESVTTPCYVFNQKHVTVFVPFGKTLM